MKSHIDPKEFELLSRLEAEVRKLNGMQVTVGIFGAIKEINEHRRRRAQIAAAQPKVSAWKP